MRPLVSIGLPVFNGERYLRKTIDSLLRQTLENFELIISDNASSDGTQKICEEIARKDSRVCYIRQPVNIGAPRNWNVVARHARSKYFKWASASDICPPYVLERAVEILERQPDVVLCYGQTQWVDEDGHELETEPGDIDCRDRDPSFRFFRVCTEMTVNNAQCGVVRMGALRKTALDRLYPSGDMALTAELALHGKLHLVPEIFAIRTKSKETFTWMLSPLERQRVYDPKARTAMKLILARRHVDNVASITRTPLSAREKLTCYEYAAKLAWWDRQKLWQELRSLFR